MKETRKKLKMHKNRSSVIHTRTTRKKRKYHFSCRQLNEINTIIKFFPFSMITCCVCDIWYKKTILFSVYRCDLFIKNKKERSENHLFFLIGLQFSFEDSSYFSLSDILCYSLLSYFRSFLFIDYHLSHKEREQQHH